MKKSLLKKLTTGALIATTLFTFIGCGSDEKKEIKVDKPNFETQDINLDNYSFKIPSTWSKLDVDLGFSGYNCFAPEGVNIENGTSSVNIIVNKSTDNPTLKDLKANTAVLEKQINQTFTNATSFKYDSFTAPAGDVFEMSYTASANGVTLDTVQYMVLVKGYSIVITGSSIEDNLSPSAKEVAKYMAQTFKIK